MLTCDYDGTLAHDGVLDDTTAAALDRFRTSGRRLVNGDQPRTARLTKRLPGPRQI